MNLTVSMGLWDAHGPGRINSVRKLFTETAYLTFLYAFLIYKMKNDDNNMKTDFFSNRRGQFEHRISYILRFIPSLLEINHPTLLSVRLGTFCKQ